MVKLLQNRIDILKLFVKCSLRNSIIKIFLFSFLGSSTFSYALSTASEDEIKAAFLYKLKHFVTWPQQVLSNKSNFFICLLGQDPFNEKIDLIVGEQTTMEHLVKVLRITEIEQAKDCQILFISESKQLWLDSIFKWLDHKPILNVSDIQDFASHGGMIEFYQEEDRVRLAINPQNMSEATLKASAHLLRVSKIVYSNTRKGKVNE